MNKERKIKKLQIEIYKDQEENLNNHFLEVLIAAKNNEPIPNESVLKIIDVISEVWECEDAYTFELINQIYNRFNKDYDFKSKRKIIQEVHIGDDLGVREIMVKMDLKLYIEEIIILTKDKKYKDKRECVYDIYKVAENIYLSTLDTNAKKKLSHYIRCALSGYIAIKYGFYLFPGVNRNREFTNDELHQKARHLVESKTKKMNKKKRESQ